MEIRNYELEVFKVLDSVKICGIPHKIVLCEDHFDEDLHFGQIDFAKCIIKLNKDLPKEAMDETLTHEILHGILVHLGYNDESQNEQFVQAVANAINQTFSLKDTRCIGASQQDNRFQKKPDIF